MPRRFAGAAPWPDIRTTARLEKSISLARDSAHDRAARLDGQAEKRDVAMNDKDE
jgi:hypothetical protein